MNELEKALEQLNIKYETSGKQYKIPTTKENLIELLKGYMALTEHLEEKINNATEYIINHSEEYKPHFRKIELDTVQCNELLNILEEE